jgi:GNAT superfamily N-acetyltransferase
MRDCAEVALLTERALRPDCVVLGEEDVAVGKALLARDTSTPFGPWSLNLQACDSDQEWALYEDHRVPVEREFGLEEAEARALVRLTHERVARLGLRLWLATDDGGQVVGGIAAFRHSQEATVAARLQEVDIFPTHRGQGFGTALLEAARLHLDSEGASVLIIGADEDDWPLHWYRRLGFRDVARVQKHVPRVRLCCSSLRAG